MDPRLFGDAWARLWCSTLNDSSTYRRAAAAWEGAVVLVMRADAASGVEAERAVFLDLWHGSCRAARVASATDRDHARYVIEASPTGWLEVLSGGVSPITALLSGRLRLVRGSVMSLLPYAHAAKELVDTAVAVHARFLAGEHA
jgi:putative sterol carrier protein